MVGHIPSCWPCGWPRAASRFRSDVGGRLVLFAAVYITLDTALNLIFARRVSFPLFAHLRTTALGKIFAMPLEFHQRETPGALVAKVNNGVGRVVQTGEAVSRELVPALIRTRFQPHPAPALRPRGGARHARRSPY